MSQRGERGAARDLFGQSGAAAAVRAAVAAKVAAEHAREPTLTPQHLQTITSRTFVLVTDDDEVRLEHAR
ncbi:MAG: hypothetical protein ACRDT0_24050 [Pseudonocardiaceae bacterium]